MTPQPIQLQPTDPKVQSYIAEQRKAGFKDDAIAQAIQAKGHPRAFVDAAMGGAKQAGPGFFGELGGNLQNTASGLFDTLKGVALDPQGAQHGVAEAVWNSLNGMGEEMRQQQKQAGQQFSSDPIGAVSRGIVGSIPVVGPGVMKSSDQFRAGHIGAGIADYLSTLASVLSPEDVGGAASSVAERMGIRDVGQSTIRHQLGYGPQQRVPPRAAMEQLAMEQHATPSETSMGKLQGILQTSMDTARREIQKHGNLPLDTQKVLERIEDAFNSEVSTANGHLPKAKQLLNMWEEFVDTFGDHISVKKAQELKQDTWARLSDADFQKEAGQQPGLKQALLSKGIGLKQAIEDATGGPNTPLAGANQKAHIALSLQQRLQEIASKEPDSLSKAAPYIAGSTVLGAGAALGFGGGGLHIGAAATGAGLAGVLVSQAMRDPATMMRLGYFLNEVGRGRGTQFVSHLPRVSTLSRMASEGEQTRKQVPTALGLGGNQ